jgi:putative NADH-flavin reductase
MKIALIGATGFVGAPILAEALMHDEVVVTAIVRNIQALPRHDRLTAVACDIHDADRLANMLHGHDVVIHAFHPNRADADVYDQYVAGHHAIITAIKAAEVPRLLAVGGAASLKTPEGIEYINSPLWNKAFDPYKQAILGTRALFGLLKQEAAFDWVFLAPSVMLRPGERTGVFRYGHDHVLFDDKGNSRISLEDYALAMIEEALRPRHHRERFTVGY